MIENNATKINRLNEEKVTVKDDSVNR